MSGTTTDCACKDVHLTTLDRIRCLQIERDGLAKALADKESAYADLEQAYGVLEQTYLAVTDAHAAAVDALAKVQAMLKPEAGL